MTVTPGGCCDPMTVRENNLFAECHREQYGAGEHVTPCGGRGVLVASHAPGASCRTDGRQAFGLSNPIRLVRVVNETHPGGFNESTYCHFRTVPLVCRRGAVSPATPQHDVPRGAHLDRGARGDRQRHLPRGPVFSAQCHSDPGTTVTRSPRGYPTARRALRRALLPGQQLQAEAVHAGGGRPDVGRPVARQRARAPERGRAPDGQCPSHRRQAGSVSRPSWGPSLHSSIADRGGPPCRAARLQGQALCFDLS